MACEPLIDAKQASELLGLHPKTVKEMAAAGAIPGMKIGKLWKFRESVLDDWMNERLHSSRHPRPTLEESR